MDGFLYKKGGSGLGSATFKLGRKNWLERWFLLEETTLTYYDAAFREDGSPAGAARGSVDVFGAEIADLPDAHGKRFLFWVKPGKAAKELILMAASEAQKALWVEALDFAAHGAVRDFAVGRFRPSGAVWIPKLQPDFNVRVLERFGPSSLVVLRELDESDRFVQKSAESTSI